MMGLPAGSSPAGFFVEEGGAMADDEKRSRKAKALSERLQRNEKSLKRSIAADLRKVTVGFLVILNRKQHGMNFEEAVARVMKAKGRSRSYVIAAAGEAKRSLRGKLHKPRKPTPASKALKFLLDGLGRGPKKRAAIVHLAKRTGIKPRTLERVYQEVGLHLPAGRRSSVWQLSDRARKRSRQDQKISRQLAAWEAGGK
jgi:hypothetical protein